MNVEAQTLIEAIRLLDAGLDSANAESYLEIRRWWQRSNGTEDNEQDEGITIYVRSLLREKLGGFPLDAIGAAVLADIDAKGPQA